MYGTVPTCMRPIRAHDGGRNGGSGRPDPQQHRLLADGVGCRALQFRGTDAGGRYQAQALLRLIDHAANQHCGCPNPLQRHDGSFFQRESQRRLEEVPSSVRTRDLRLLRSFFLFVSEVSAARGPSAASPVACNAVLTVSCSNLDRQGDH